MADLPEKDAAVEMFTKGKKLFEGYLEAIGENSAYVAYFCGVTAWIDGLQGAAHLAISMSKKGPVQHTTDQEKAEMIATMLQDKYLGELSLVFAMDCLNELRLRHNNFSTHLTDSPEDIASRVDRIVLSALEQYLQHLAQV